MTTKHDESDTADADTLTGRKTTTDGGVLVREAATDAEILEGTGDVFEGPFPETDKYGELTGEDYVLCRDCSCEILTGRKEYATHKEGCRFGGDY